MYNEPMQDSNKAQEVTGSSSVFQLKLSKYLKEKSKAWHAFQFLETYFDNSSQALLKMADWGFVFGHALIPRRYRKTRTAIEITSKALPIALQAPDFVLQLRHYIKVAKEGGST